jgi:hypothetical protein
MMRSKLNSPQVEARLPSPLPQLVKAAGSVQKKVITINLSPLKIFAKKLPDSALREAISEIQEEVDVATYLALLPIFLRLSRRIKL